MSRLRRLLSFFVSVALLAVPALASPAPAREVAFVDGAVAGHEALVAGVRPGVETVLLDPAGDALAQMVAWAETHSGYEAIHVVSHGAPGALRLGGASLDGAALRDPAVAGQLARLGRALNRGGDLLLYGCELAKGEAGAQFVADLAQLTGVDVGASDNKTGAAAKGGDWVLEVAVGAIEARSLAMGEYQGVLSTITFLETDADVFGTHSTITRPETVSGKSITFTAASGQRLTSLYDTDGSFGLDPLSSDATGTYLKLSAPAGYTFDLTSFAATISGGSLSITLTYGDGQQNSFTHSGSGTTLSTQSGFSPSIDNVTAVEISSLSADLFNDFVITDVKAPPTFSGSFTHVFSDTAAADSFANASGTLTATPVGTATIVSYGLTDGTSGTYDVGGSSYNITKAGSYGTLYLNSSTGAYVYVPNGAAIEELSTETVGGSAYRVTKVDSFDVTATDSVGATAETTGLNGVYISLTGQNDRPEITSGATVSVVENTAGTVYTATATDRDSGQALSYSLSGSDAGLFTIDPNTGAVSFNSPPDFDAPADSDLNNVYEITVTATDDALVPNAFSSDPNYNKSAPKAVQITVGPTPPYVATIARTQAGPVTLAETLEWRVTFTESVTGVDLADFELTAVDGAATATLGTVTPGANAAEYFVTATGVAGVGTLRLDVKSSGTGILDAESNALSGGFIHGQPYTRTLGTVPVAWGYNSYGQLGLGAKDYNPHALPVVVHRTGALAGKTMVAISAGSSHSLALCSDGTLAAWGWNSYGQLGDSLTADSLTPVPVDAASGTSPLYGKTVVAISVGGEYSLALCSDGKVYAWGWNYYGQLGNGGKTTDYSTPTPTPVAVQMDTGALAGKTVVAISAGPFHSLALCSDGTLVAWGFNSKGQLGNGLTVDSPTPVAVSTASGTSALYGKTVVAISAGYMHSLALCRDGTVVAWGFNNFGQLGNGLTVDSPTPVAVTTTPALSGKTVVSVAAGTNYSVALCSDGTAAIWGWNTYGQLGDGTTDYRLTPVAVNTASGTSALYGKTVVALAPGSDHLLALCSDGTVAAWGRNYYGQLGNGATDNSFTPVSINAVAGSALASRSVGLLMSSAAASHNFAFVSATPITAVATPAAGTYKLGDTLTFTLTPSDTVTVDTTAGTPRLTLTIGAATRYATYDAASSTSTSLVFTYTLATGDTDADGLAVASAIDLNGGTITDAFSLSIELSLPVYTLPVIAIDTTPPAVPAITSTAPVGTTTNPSYTLTGTAEAGATVKIYNAGSLVDTVTADAEGHWSCALTLADGATALTVTASDAVGNESAAVADTSWTIDTTAPEVATIARNQPGPVTPADTLEWRVTFTESVTGVDMADFELKSVDGAATATLATVTPELTKTGVAGVQYLVTATGVAGIGTLRLDVKTGGTGIADALGHAMTEGHTYGQPYTHALGTVPVIWGKNDYGQLGLGFADGTASPVAHPLPAFVPNTGALAGKTVVALAVGGGHTLALDREGKVYAWGRNEAGQVGNGTTDSPLLTPVEVIGLGVTVARKVVAIAAGGSHSVALFNDGTVYSWGWNNYGQLGSDTPSGSSSSRATTPAAAKVDSSSALHDKTVVGIAAGMNYTLALCSDGTLAAWGYNNYGQLGNGTSTGSATPGAVVRGEGSALHGKTVVAIAAGSYHSAALCSDGTLTAWGSTWSGQLGNGTIGDGLTMEMVPVAVDQTSGGSALSGKAVVGLALGSSYSLALCADGAGALTPASWGMNNYGQLGIGTLETPKATPMAVKMDGSSALTGKTVVGLAAGNSHSLALCADGTLAAWGRNDSGQLGDATTTNSDTPKAINASNNLDLAGSALLGRTPYLFATGSYAYHSAVLVSATPVTAVATPAAGTYKAGDTLSFTLTTGSAVTVTGTPRLALSLGSTTVHATYDAASSTGTNLVFTYTVQAGDTDADGIAVASAIDLNGGTITDTSGWSIALALPAYTLPAILVDGIAPTAPAITSISSTAIGGTAEPGSTVRVYDGITLLGTTTADGSGNWSLVLSLADGDYSLTAQATDGVGNVGTASSAGTYTVDTVAPAVATIARTQPGPVTLADTLEWRVTFTEAVTGVDAADFALTAVDGAATATLGTVTAGANAAEYFVTATGVAGVGTLRLDVKASGTGIVDGSANALAAGFTLGQPYTHALGTVPVAWGDNYSGQFGLGSADGAAHPVPALVPRTGALAGKTVVAVAAAGAHSLALCSDGTVAAWGWNSYGQLGNGLTVDSPTPVAVNTSGALAGKKVVALAAGHGYSLALCSDGTVAAWGGNSAGQLGNGSTVDSSTPVAVDTSGALAGKTVVAVAAGLEHSLALCRDGTVAAWGGGYNGQLGNPSLGSPYSSTPVAVDVSGALAGKTVVALAAGCAHSLALCSDSQVYAWGRNDYGQLGDTTTTNSSRPVAVDTSGALAGKTVVAVAAGNEHSLALDSEGQVVAWGYNSAGQLGNPSLGSFDSATPVAVSTAATSALAGKAVVALAAGEAHSLALDSEGQVVAWGYNYFGQLGNGSTGDSSTPVAVNTAAPSALVGRTVYALASGCWAGHSLALASPAAITTVATPAAGAYKAGDTLTFTLTLDGAATVDTTGGTPRLALTIGAATRYATYDAASSTGTSLVFTSTVQAGDTDADGIAVANAIDLNGGTLTDAAGWPVVLALPAYTPPTITVDTVAPVLTSVTLISDNATPTLAKAGDVVTLSFTANETLQTPTVTLVGEPVTASYDIGTSTWTATHTVAAGDAEGDATFSIAYRDLAGNAGTTVTTTTDASEVTVDLTGPETTFDGTPGAWSGSLVMFDFIVDSDVVRYEASLDGAAYAPVLLPAFFSDLADGPHTLMARAVDAAGNVDATPAVHTWTVDTVAPAAPTIGAITSTGVSGTAEAGSTVEVFNGSTSLGTATADASGNWSLALPLADGSYSLTATATDAAGHRTSTTAPTTRNIDTVAPTLAVVTLLSDNAHDAALAKAGDTVALSFTASETLQTPTVTLAGESATASYDSGTNTWTATRTVAAGDEEGTVAFSITFSDVAGNTGTAVTTTTDASAVTVDLTAPETTITAQPASLSASVSATFAFSGTGAARYEASLDGAAYAAATSPATFAGLAEGAHTFAVRAIDAAGNVDATPANYTWAIDATAPSAPTIGTITPTGVSGTAEAGSTVEVFNGSTSLGTATADVSGNWNIVLSLADGSYSVTATSTDAAGHRTSTTAPTTRNLDTVAPTLAVVMLLSDNAHDAAFAGVGDTVALSFTASETIQTPTVTLAGEIVTAAFDSATGAWLATHTVAAADIEGAVIFAIAFRDLAGNTGTAVTATTDASAVTIDLTAPETTITAQPASLSASVSATFTFNGTDATGSGVASFEASLDGAAHAPATSPATFAGLAEGAHTFAVRAIDAAGNMDATPATYTWTIDPTAPAPPVIGVITPTGVSGTGEPGSMVRIYDGRTVLGTATVGADGTWAIPLGILSGGAHTLTASMADAAGNTSAGQTFRFASTHSGDSDGDWRIGLPELLRMVELFNTTEGSIRTGAYHSDTAAADGFAPGAGLLPYYHTADSDRSGRLELPELLRAIELYNAMSGTTRTGAYHLDSSTADGFATGAN